MYHLDHRQIDCEHAHHAAVAPFSGGLQAVVFAPGWLVLLAMEAVLQCPGAEAGWRAELRRQRGSAFFGRIYAGIFWIMLASMVSVLMLA